MKKILLVEDDKHIRDLYVEILKNGGYEVAVAVDGQEGYESIVKGDYDIVLLDVILPKIDGREILRKLQAENTFPEGKPIVLLTNLSEEAVVKNGEILKYDEYIVKSSITPDVLLERVGKYFEETE